MPLKTSSKEVKCNTKIKEYRDGSYTITRSDRHIFKDPAFEYHCKHEHSIDELSRQEQLKTARENYICYFEYEDENGNILASLKISSHKAVKFVPIVFKEQSKVSLILFIRMIGSTFLL